MVTHAIKCGAGTASACRIAANTSAPLDSLAKPCSMKPKPTIRRNGIGAHRAIGNCPGKSNAMSRKDFMGKLVATFPSSFPMTFCFGLISRAQLIGTLLFHERVSCAFRLHKRNEATHVPEQTNVGERLKMCGSRELYVAAQFRTDCDEEHVTANRQVIDKCRNVDFSSDAQCPVFLSMLEELCASSRVERAADDSIHILGKDDSRIRRFYKEYLSCP